MTSSPCPACASRARAALWAAEARVHVGCLRDALIAAFDAQRRFVQRARKRRER